MFTRPYRWDTINLVPFEELRKLWGYGYFWTVIYNVAGNVLWFIPLGFLVQGLFPRWRILIVALCGMVVSFSIKLLQFICVTGITDIDDVLINTVGALIGCLMYRSVVRFLRR